MLLGGADEVLGRRDAKVAALILVEKTTEDGRRVKLWPVAIRVSWLASSSEALRTKPKSLPAHKVEASVDAEEGAGMHVTNHAIVLYGQIAARLTAARVAGMRG